MRTDRIQEPKDLKGRKVGVPEYQLTANVWARSILKTITASACRHPLGARRHRARGRTEKISVELPPGVRLDDAPEGKTISELIEEGEIDGFIAPRPPRSWKEAIRMSVGCSATPPLSPRTISSAPGFSRSMHAVGIRSKLVEKHPWLPAAVIKAFEHSKAAALEKSERHLGHQGDVAIHRRAARRGARLMATISGPMASN